MIDTSNVSFDFLSSFIEQLLDGAGFDTLSERTRQQYIPQFVAEAERRLGLAVIPLLTEESVKELTTLVEGSPSAKELNNFWKQAVPKFDEVVKHTLNNFAEEMKKTLGIIREA